MGYYLSMVHANRSMLTKIEAGLQNVETILYIVSSKNSNEDLKQGWTGERVY